MVDVIAAPGWHSFRDYGRFTYYHESFLAARNADPRFLRVVVICALFSLAAIVAVLGIRGRERWFALLKTICTLYIGVALLLGLHGKYWQVGYVNTEHAYFSQHKTVPASIGVFVGLTEFNITFDATVTGTGENIYLSEEFHWADRLTRGGRLAIKDFEAVRKKGLPFALVTVADHLSCDFGGLKWARRNRQAGYYAHICLWTAFAVWLVCNISFSMVVSYGAKQMLLCGLLTVLGVVLYAGIQPAMTMSIAFEDGVLDLKYGWCFWMVLAAGIESTLLGLIIWIVNVVAPKRAAAIFHLRSSDEEYYYYDEFDTSMPRTPTVGASNDGVTFDYSPGQSPLLRKNAVVGVDNPVFEDEEGHLMAPNPTEPTRTRPEKEETRKDSCYDSGLNSPASKESSEQGSDADPKEKLDSVAVDVDVHTKHNAVTDDENVTRIDLIPL